MLIESSSAADLKCGVTTNVRVIVFPSPSNELTPTVTLFSLDPGTLTSCLTTKSSRSTFSTPGFAPYLPPASSADESLPFESESCDDEETHTARMHRAAPARHRLSLSEITKRTLSFVGIRPQSSIPTTPSLSGTYGSTDVVDDKEPGGSLTRRRRAPRSRSRRTFALPRP